MKRIVKQAKWWVYILECRDGSLYTGITLDLERRFQLHRQGKAAAYTRAHRPERLLWSRAAASRSKALKLEWAIKQMTKERKLSLVAGKLNVVEVLKKGLKNRKR
jgi:putative endonuclease